MRVGIGGTEGKGDTEAVGDGDGLGVPTHWRVARSKTKVIPGVELAHGVSTAPGVLISTGAKVKRVPFIDTIRTGPTNWGVS